MPPKRKLPSTITELAAATVDSTTLPQTPSKRQKTISMRKRAVPPGKQNTPKLKTTSKWSPTHSIPSLSSYDFPNENCLMWFRSDLRLQDNPALSTASRIAHANSKFLFALYIISPQDWQLHDTAAIKVNFIMRSLKVLKEKLAALNIPLIVETVEEKKNIARALTDICQRINVSHVFSNIEYEVDEKKRDKECQSECETHKIKIEFFHDQCVAIPGSIVSKENKPYTVYTPFKKNWLSTVESTEAFLQLSPPPATPFPSSIQSTQPSIFSLPIPSSPGIYEYPPALLSISCELYPAGEDEAHKRLNAFIEKKINSYHDDRDIPCIDGSSGLSPYLASGVISCRQCVNAARRANGNKLQTGKKGIVSWIAELVWRDFYRHVLVAFPRVCMNRAYKIQYENVEWNENEEMFQRWCEGKTGYPIVDAGMRQLNGSGWMHNRVRMIVAMFLVKDLLINWQKGEKYFMQHLIDGDFANNNGGWQWCASSGTDAQPYFRIFNPLLQSQKFDRDGIYIRKWVPELRSLSSKLIHDPYGSLSSKEFQRLGYPAPIVDHKVARQLCLERFKEALGK